MNLLPCKVRLHDIQCVESFVAAAVHKLGLVLTPHEREELIADGLEILYTLNATYRPGPGKFSAYATSRLPLRLIDRHHQHHRGEHIKTAKGGFRYRPPIASWEGELERPAFDEGRVTPLVRFAHPPKEHAA